MNLKLGYVHSFKFFFLFNGRIRKCPLTSRVTEDVTILYEVVLFEVQSVYSLTRSSWWHKNMRSSSGVESSLF